MVLPPRVGCVGLGVQDAALGLAVGQKEPFVLWLVQGMEGVGGHRGLGCQEEPGGSSTSAPWPPNSAGKREMAGPAPRLPEP